MIVIVLQVNFKLVRSGTPLKLVLLRQNRLGWREPLFLVCLIFTQFEANLTQSKFKYNFCNIYNINFENMLMLLLADVIIFYPHIKQSVRSR